MCLLALRVVRVHSPLRRAFFPLRYRQEVDPANGYKTFLWIFLGKEMWGRKLATTPQMLCLKISEGLAHADNSIFYGEIPPSIFLNTWSTLYCFPSSFLICQGLAQAGNSICYGNISTYMFNTWRIPYCFLSSFLICESLALAGNSIYYWNTSTYMFKHLTYTILFPIIMSVSHSCSYIKWIKMDILVIDNARKGLFLNIKKTEIMVTI